MGIRVHPDCIKDAFELYLHHNGQRFDLIDEEMHKRGWPKFKATSTLPNRGIGKNFREGWVERYGWKKSLEIKIATAGLVAQTSGESLLFEVEEIRKKLFIELTAKGVGKDSRDIVYQHDKYIARTTEILATLEGARDNFANYAFFLAQLLEAATEISPSLANELCDAEDGLIAWAERKFTVKPKADS